MSRQEQASRRVAGVLVTGAQLTLDRAHCVVHHHPVAEHHPLGLPGGARGVVHVQAILLRALCKHLSTQAGGQAARGGGATGEKGAVLQGLRRGR